MAKGVPYDPTVKAEIVSKIRDQGLSVSVASAQVLKASTPGSVRVSSTVTAT